MSDELHRKYRPQSFKRMFGQKAAVSILSGFITADKVPHQLLFTGDSGCGKTTLARILRTKLDCADRDFKETNCADFNGINMVRDIRRNMQLAPMGGKVRVYLIDEAHMLSKDAQNAFLKILEEPPDHVYFMLATTDPHRLLKTVRTRCTEVKVELLSDKELESLIDFVAEKEGIKLAAPIKARLVSCSQGSARKALVLLHTIMGMTDKEDQLKAIQAADSAEQGITICRALMNTKTTWPEMQAIIKAVEEDPEDVRRGVLGYAAATLLNANTGIHPRAYLILIAFSENYFSTGRAGLVASCYEVLGKKR